VPSGCLTHSFAAHTSFDIAVPYPEFLPRVNLKFEDFVVFNTNNALHALRIFNDDGTTSPTQDVVQDDQNQILSVQVGIAYVHLL